MRSDNINELAMALAKAQGSMQAATKDAKNPHLGNRYATLDSIIDSVRKPLFNNGLCFSQLLQQGEGGLILETWLFHSSGQFLQSEVEVSPVAVKGINEMQALGSALTYLKRYALSAMLGVSVDEDDDGNAVKNTSQPKAKTPSVNGNKSPTSPSELLQLINQRIRVPYDNEIHLFNAIRQESTLDNYQWPKSSDLEGWRMAYKHAKKHADIKSSSEATAEKTGAVDGDDWFEFATWVINELPYYTGEDDVKTALVELGLTFDVDNREMLFDELAHKASREADELAAS